MAKIAHGFFIFGDVMDWEDLKVFLGVAEAGSLAGAARRLRVSQATIWRRIRSLEGALDATLFERSASGYVLTAAGLRFLGGLEGLQRRVELARQRLAEEDPAAEGEVRLAAPEFVGLMLADGLPSFAERHPRLVIELLTGSPAASLMARDVDIALRAERLFTGGFTLEGVYPIPFGLYATPGYLERFGSPQAIDRLKGHRLIEFDHSMAHVAPRQWQRAAGGGATVAFRSNSPHARLAAARAGLGMAMLPQPLAHRCPELVLVLPPAQVGSLDLMMFVSAELRREARVIALRDFLADLLGRSATDHSPGDGTRRTAAASRRSRQPA